MHVSSRQSVDAGMFNNFRIFRSIGEMLLWEELFLIMLFLLWMTIELAELENNKFTSVIREGNHLFTASKSISQIYFCFCESIQIQTTSLTTKHQIHSLKCPARGVLRTPRFIILAYFFIIVCNSDSLLRSPCRVSTHEHNNHPTTSVACRVSTHQHNNHPTTFVACRVSTHEHNNHPAT